MTATTQGIPQGYSAARVSVEICVDDLEGALVADREGADRIELCANLIEGGTTPSMGTLLSVVRSVKNVEVQVIIRPRGGNFVYSDAEIEVMCRDLEVVADVARESRTGVGVVFGALTPRGEVDVPIMRRLINASGNLPVTFHKAFDVTPDLLLAYQALRELGVQRVLTSGGPHPAVEGLEVLAELVRRSRMEADSPTILVGGSVRPSNVGAIIDATHATEVHLRAQTASPRKDGTLQTDPVVVRELLAAINVGNAAAESLHETGQSSLAVIAMDVGGTNLKGALVHASGRTLVSRPISAGATGQETIDRIIELSRDLQSYADQNGHAVVGVGVVTPGMVDSETGIVRFASSLDWANVPLKDILSSALGVPVHIGHDVRSSGLAEDLFGASRGRGDSVLVAIGTGVAASIQSGSHHVLGAITTAGELGHIPVVPNGETCTCGQIGCLEVYHSGAGIARRYAAAGGEPGLDAAAIVSRLGSDPVADEVWSDGVTALALGLTSLTLLIDPAVIVLTGGVSRAGEALLEPLRAQLAKSLVWREPPELRLSELGTSGGRIGAAVLAFRVSGRGQIVDKWTRTDVLAEPSTLNHQC